MLLCIALLFLRMGQEPGRGREELWAEQPLNAGAKGSVELCDRDGKGEIKVEGWMLI